MYSSDQTARGVRPLAVFFFALRLPFRARCAMMRADGRG